MESLPGYDNWKCTPPDEPEVEVLLHEILKRPLDHIEELSLDGDEEWRVGCDEPFQHVDLRFGLLSRDNDEAIHELADRLERTVKILRLLSQTK